MEKEELNTKQKKKRGFGFVLNIIFFIFIVLLISYIYLDKTDNQTIKNLNEKLGLKEKNTEINKQIKESENTDKTDVKQDKKENETQKFIDANGIFGSNFSQYLVNLVKVYSGENGNIYVIPDNIESYNPFDEEYDVKTFEKLTDNNYNKYSEKIESIAGISPNRRDLTGDMIIKNGRVFINYNLPSILNEMGLAFDSNAGLGPTDSYGGKYYYDGQIEIDDINSTSVLNYLGLTKQDIIDELIYVFETEIEDGQYTTYEDDKKIEEENIKNLKEMFLKNITDDIENSFVDKMNMSMQTGKYSIYLFIDDNGKLNINSNYIKMLEDIGLNYSNKPNETFEDDVFLLNQRTHEMRKELKTNYKGTPSIRQNDSN